VYDDEVTVETRLTDVRSRLVVFEYVITNAATGARLVSASTRLASVSRQGGTVALPPDVRALLEQALAESDGGQQGSEAVEPAIGAT
jgi:acyl-CoA thioesterase FadM